METLGTGAISEERIEDAVWRVFDFRPAAIIKHLSLRRPIYKRTAQDGHFGIEHPDATWERLDSVEALRKAAGVGLEAA
jgi:S-adenosylmethionine synthetase